VERKKKRGLSSEHKLIYTCEPGTFIKEMIATLSHVILNIDTFWTNTRSAGKLEFLPHRETVT
jgi:hypothetical protein